MPGWSGRAHIERALDGGITNRNYVVVCGADRFVLRVCGDRTNLLEIDRMREHEAATRAASLGIAPRVIEWVESAGLLVTSYIHGRTITPADLASTDGLAAVCAALRKFHASGPLSGDFDAFVVPFLHREAAVSCNVAIPDEFAAAELCARQIAAAFAADPEPKMACHNDLLNANFLRDDTQLWLLDWEYAGNNDRYFDLGNMAVNNDFDADADEALVLAYFGSVTRRRLARLRLMRIMSDFREAMWGVVQQGLSTLEFDYVSYAAKHFDRLLSNATTPGYRRSLDDAATPDAAPDT